MLVTNIQRFSLHDGPGIRTTIFLKGCSLRCPWCSNPENLNPYPENYFKDGVTGIYGKEYSAEEIFNEVIKDKFFYESDGGVTFSGGEPILQAEDIIPVMKKCNDEGITSAIETCLFVPTEKLVLLLPYVDYFFVDMKIMDRDKCFKQIKGNIDLYHKNLRLLCEQKKITIRIPVIGRYTDYQDNRKQIINYLKKYEKSIAKIELIKEHNLGQSKYRSLSLKEPDYIGVSDSLMIQYKNEIESVVDANVDICKI